MRTPFSDSLRRAIDESGMSRYRICKLIGLNQATMSRFMSGKGGLSFEALNKLAELLKLRVVPERRRKGK